MLTDQWQKLTLNFRIFIYLRRFIKESRLPGEKIRSLQFLRLKALLCDAYATHAFYRKRFDAAGFDPFHMREPDEIKRIPILSKEEYRQFTNDFFQQQPGRCNAWYRDGTSGSTGMPLTIYRTWDERAYMSAKWMGVLYCNGYTRRDRTFSIPSPHRLQRESIIQNFGLFARYSVPYNALAEEMVTAYLKCKPTIIYANKSQLVVMALYCQKNGINLPKPRLCVSAAETMDAGSRALITGLFGEDCLVEAYGTVETNILAWQERGEEDVFRVSHATNLLEVLNDDAGRTSGAQNNTNTGRAVVTDFFIRSFPLIRYDLGDVLETETCNGVTVIRKIRGRMDDWVIFPDGDRRSFHFFYEIMERRPEILQFRVIQEAYDRIRINAVKAPDGDAEALERDLLSDLRREVRDDGVTYVIEWVDDIPPDPNGKLRMLISRVGQAPMPPVEAPAQ
jgi:phenylacetate-CoA ligase